MLVQFGNNWMKKIPLTAKLDSACGLVQFWLSWEFFSSNYFQIGQHVVLLHIQIQLPASITILPWYRTQLTLQFIYLQNFEKHSYVQHVSVLAVAHSYFFFYSLNPLFGDVLAAIVVVVKPGLKS